MATKQRYFIHSNQVNDQQIYIIGEDVHHIKNVMRMKEGNEISCFDEQGILYEGEILSISEQVVVSIKEKRIEQNELSKEVAIAHGLVRREKTEEVIRRLVELGCRDYVPILMKRSIVKFTKDKSTRFETIIKEASEQSHRNQLMKVHHPLNWEEFFQFAKSYDCCLFAHIANTVSHLKEHLFDSKPHKILIVVGPEGGFDPTEVINLEKHGFLPIGLGKRILRTETAPLYIMSACSYELGE